MNAFTYEGFSNVSSHSTTTTIDASGTTTTWSDTSSDQTYEYAAATVISGTSVGPGATTPVQFDHTWSTSGGITYPNGQTETWSNGATYTNPAQSGFILPAGLTVHRRQDQRADQVQSIEPYEL